MHRSALVTLIVLGTSHICAANPTSEPLNIVYSARYYYPSKSRKTSHFHIYLTSVNGRHTRQLTFGTDNDYDPLWSPNGRAILFLRAGDDFDSVIAMQTPWNHSRTIFRTRAWRPTDTRRTTLNTKWVDNDTILIVARSYNVATGYSTKNETLMFNLRDSSKTKRIPVTYAAISPDRQSTFIQNGNGRCIVRCGKTSVAVKPIRHAQWIDDHNVVGIVEADAGDTQFRVYSREGLEVGTYTFWKIAKPDPGEEDLGNWETWTSVPGIPPQFTFALNEAHDLEGARRIWRFFRWDRKTMSLEGIAEGKSISWRNDGKAFCLVPPTGLSNYGDQRRILTAPLQVVDTSSNKATIIVSGLVWVWWADWKK